MTRKSVAGSLSDPRLSPDRACAGLETELFFPNSRNQALAAQRVCEHCPVLASCAAWALRQDMTDGVVASVWLPSSKATLPTKRTAWKRLEFVASTGLASMYQGAQPGQEAA
ncbi:WhiB family transcriptional regulator [Nocardia sp. NPDC059239]|uniref:WhiB family transcriptional regulator n=1 Tax=unclassified Nocardia TaxID=2637762 RepID=UPI003676717A